MSEEEKVKIKINIAGEALFLHVPFSKQEAARQTESEVNLMYETWRNRFPGKNDRELLAMIAFRYAERYAALMKELKEQNDAIQEMEGWLDRKLSEGGR